MENDDLKPESKLAGTRPPPRPPRRTAIGLWPDDDEDSNQAQADAQKALDQARAYLRAATAAVASAPAGQDSRAGIEAMKGELLALQKTLAEAQMATAAGDYATARHKADQVKQQAAAISTDVAHAVYRRKRA